MQRFERRKQRENHRLRLTRNDEIAECLDRSTLPITQDLLNKQTKSRLKTNDFWVPGDLAPNDLILIRSELEQ